MKSLLFAGVLLIATPALAQPTERPVPAPSESGSATGGGAAERTEPRICRRIEAVGTRLRVQRVCMTAREWREYERQN